MKRGMQEGLTETMYIYTLNMYFYTWAPSPESGWVERLFLWRLLV